MIPVTLLLVVLASSSITVPADVAPPAEATAVEATPAELLAAVRTYEAAVNRHDWHAVVPLLADEVTVDLGGGLSLVGLEAVKRLHGWERSLRTEIHYSDCVVDGGLVTCRAVETNEFTRLAGLDPVIYTATELRFVGGRLARMSATLDQASASAVSASLAPFLAWATAFGPDSVSEFMRPDGSFAFSDAAGDQFTRLLRIYQVLQRGVVAVRA